MIAVYLNVVVLPFSRRMLFVNPSCVVPSDDEATDADDDPEGDDGSDPGDAGDDEDVALASTSKATSKGGKRIRPRKLITKVTGEGVDLRPTNKQPASNRHKKKAKPSLTCASRLFLIIFFLLHVCGTCQHGSNLTSKVTAH